MRRQKSIVVSIVESTLFLIMTATIFCISYLIIMRFILGGLPLISLVKYAIFVPHIVRSHESNLNARAIHPIYATVAVIENLFMPMYAWLMSPNFLYTQYNPRIATTLATFLIAHAICLFMLYKRFSGKGSSIVPSAVLSGVPSGVQRGYLPIDSTESSEVAPLLSAKLILNEFLQEKGVLVN